MLNRIETLRGDEPWPGYDELTVSEVDKALRTLTDDELVQAHGYERSHKNRTGVIRAIAHQRR